MVKATDKIEHRIGIGYRIPSDEKHSRSLSYSSTLTQCGIGGGVDTARRHTPNHGRVGHRT